MPRFAANLSLLFTEVPLPERFALARRAGFRAVEIQFPYDHPPAVLCARLEAEGLALVLINTPRGEGADGAWGLACRPDRRAAFRDGLGRALDAAHALGCPRLHVMAGAVPAGLDPAAAWATFAANLDHAAEACAAAGVRPVIEPINRGDAPGYLLERPEEAAALIAAVGPARLGLLFDLYHAQVTGGDLCRRLSALLPLIAHVQVADVPGRHEPGTGEVNWTRVLGHLDAIGYCGWVGCEYRPRAGTGAGLGWMAAFTGGPAGRGGPGFDSTPDLSG